jgi:leucyl/phenylalanyl-tRNA--protein transferase
METAQIIYALLVLVLIGPGIIYAFKSKNALAKVVIWLAAFAALMYGYTLYYGGDHNGGNFGKRPPIVIDQQTLPLPGNHKNSQRQPHPTARMKAGQCAISNLADITPELLLRAYAMGIFPMADTADCTELHWYSPDPRAILPLHPFHAPKSLRKLMRHTPYQLRVDTDFAGVIHGCAEATASRPETWINDEIKNLLIELHHMGFAHSVECYDDIGQLIGGLYGVALGAAFFGESMFSRKSNASKLCLLHLFERLGSGAATHCLIASLSTRT